MSIGILPCQGSSNTGFMTTKAAVHFVNNDSINMVCPLGLPLGIDSIIANCHKNEHHIALNGCPIKCASKALEAVGIFDYQEITLTSDFKIQKNKNFQDESGLQDVIQNLKMKIDKLN